jgi:cysteinyl-tRNA synthetase
VNLDEFRVEMTQYRLAVDAEATSLKDPYVALDRLHSLYRKFDDQERDLADQVLAEWALSQDEKTRFEALALIDDFRITAAVPALHELAARLQSDHAPGAPFELEKVNRLLSDLCSS